MRVIIVDDEPLARAVLREHLAAHPDVDIVAECANGFGAVKAIGELAPDLVFLDIQMPKLDGFEVVELAGAGPRHDTHYLFVTAYDQFALKAFEVHALDYLLKPFSQARFEQALAHARARLRAAAPETAQAAAADAAKRHAPLERILVKEGARAHVVPVASVDYIEAQDDYVAIHAAGRTWLKSQRLAELEEQLDPARFVRVHRSCIVNVGAIARIEPASRDTYCAVLRGDVRVPVSRSGYQKVRDRLR